MMVSTAMAILDTTIINSVIPALLREFHSSLLSVEWIVTGYLLSMCVMLPTAGWLAEKYGYKLIYTLGMTCFTLGSLMCYISSSLGMLIFSRIIEGFGSGVVQSLGLAIIIRNFDSRHRTIALGLWGIASAAAVSMGPYMGGEMLNLFGWNSLFAVNVPIGILNILGAIIIMQETKDPNAGKFHFGGFILTALWAPLLVVGLSMGVSKSDSWLTGWDSPFVIGSLIASVIMTIGFIRYNDRSSTPIIDLKIFKDRTFLLSIIALGCLGFGFYGGNYLLPLYLEHSMSYTAVAVGGIYLPVGIIQGTLAPFSGLIAQRWGEWRLVIIGFTIFVAYLMLSIFYNQDTPDWLILTTVYMRGVGLGLAFTPLNALCVKNLTKEQMTSASGVNNTIKQVSGSLGIAIFTAIIATRLTIDKDLAPTISKSDYTTSIDYSFAIAAFFALAGLISLLFIKQQKKPNS